MRKRKKIKQTEQQIILLGVEAHTATKSYNFLGLPAV